MRDVYDIKGQKIVFENKEWEIGKVYFVPGKENLYVQLKDGNSSMNVNLTNILTEVSQIVPKSL